MYRNAEHERKESPSFLRRVPAAAKMIFILTLCLVWGCETGPKRHKEPVKREEGVNKLSAYKSFGAEKIEITPLTEMVSKGKGGGAKIKVYVSLSDSSGSQIKTPGVFRFELYEYVPRSLKSKGRRLFIWPDRDLTDTAVNNEHWRDFLRSYEFILDYDAAGFRRGILEVTCISPNGRRISSDIEIKKK